MAQKLYITFGGALYDETTRLIVERAPVLGADEVRVYDDVWLTRQEFYRQNHWLWDHLHKRGFGWYAWKPFIILHCMEKFMRDGDVVLYTDADCYPVKPFRRFYEQTHTDGGIMLFHNRFNNRQWCKRDCFVVMAQDTVCYHDAQAAVARFMLFEKGPWRPYQFLMEWLTYCVNPLATTFDPSVLAPELEGFIEHRAEQAILTLLAHKYGYTLYPEADEEMGVFHQANPRPPEESVITAAVVGSQYRNVE
jgi:hypothetical protein